VRLKAGGHGLVLFQNPPPAQGRFGRYHGAGLASRLSPPSKALLQRDWRCQSLVFGQGESEGDGWLVKWASMLPNSFFSRSP
jgi:hypothetical protein